MDKILLVEQLVEELRKSARIAHSASHDAAEEARDGATASEKRESARVCHEFSTMAKAQSRRAQKTQGELDALDRFRPSPLSAKARIEVGAIVEVEDEDTGEGRTLFIAPAGAGITLTGPGGDGLLSVVTPVSPIGKALAGRRAGDVVDVKVRGEIREWVITYVG